MIEKCNLLKDFAVYRQVINPRRTLEEHEKKACESRPASFFPGKEAKLFFSPFFP